MLTGDLFVVTGLPNAEDLVREVQLVGAALVVDRGQPVVDADLDQPVGDGRLAVDHGRVRGDLHTEGDVLCRDGVFDGARLGAGRHADAGRVPGIAPLRGVEKRRGPGRLYHTKKHSPP